MKKRNLIALLMAVCMMFSLLPVNAIAVGAEDAASAAPAEKTLLSENGNVSSAPKQETPAKDGEGDKAAAPVEGEKTGDGKAAVPVEGEKAEDGKAPAEGEKTPGAEKTAEGEKAEDGKAPAEGEKTPGAEKSAEGEKAEDEAADDEQLAEDGENGIALTMVLPDEDYYRTYEFYVGENKVAEQIVKNDETLLRPASPKKDGYKFTGWNTAEDGTGDTVSFGTVSGITETETVEAYAQFTPVLYLFFADPDGRTVITKEYTSYPVTVSTVGETYALESPDQAVVGWFFEDGTSADSVTLTDKNVTVYAKVESGHWITFDSDGGTYVPPAFYLSTAETAAPPAPTKPGYTFKGWFDKNGAAFAFGGVLEESVALTAKWEAESTTTYTINYWIENPNIGDSGYSYYTSVKATGKTGDTITLTSGQTGTDWLTSSTDSDLKKAINYNKTKTEDELKGKTIAGDGTTVVNVYFTRQEYTISFWSVKWQGGFLFGEYVKNKEYTEKRITAKYGAFIGDKWPTVNGSSTWKTTANGTTSQVGIETMPYKGFTFYGPLTGDGSETAYYYVEVLEGETGTVKKNGVEYKLHHSDTSPGTGATVSKEELYAITGFTYKEGTKIGGRYDGATFYYLRNSYSIEFRSEGKELKTVPYQFDADISGADYEPNAPEGKEGFTFGGWYDDPGFTQKHNFEDEKMPAHNMVVYAKWVEPTFDNIAFVSVSGTGASETISVRYGKTIKEELQKLVDDGKIVAPDGDGWTFAGWVTKDENGNSIPFNTDTEIYRAYTLYPSFTNKNSAGVSYVEGTHDAYTDGKTYMPGTQADVQKPMYEAPTGKVFLGWATEKDSADIAYQPNDKLTVPAAGATLYAVYGAIEDTVTLTYTANGGAGKDYVVPSLKNNGRVQLLTVEGAGFSRTGYIFAGWTTNAGGTGARFNGGDYARVNRLGENVLYAQWTPDPNTKYTVEYYYEQSDGSFAKQDPSKEGTGKTDTTVEVTKDDKTPKQPGYAFDETNKNNVLSGTIAADGSLVLKVYFKRNEITVNIIGNTKTVPYNGSEQSVTGFTSDAPADVTVALKPGKTAIAEGTNVGTHYMGLKAEDFTATSPNYSRITIKYTDGWLKINPSSEIEKNIMLTTTDVEHKYDGTTYTAGTATAIDSKGGAVKIEYSVDGATWTTNPGTITAKNVSESKTIQVRVTSANYEGSVTGTQKLTVKPVAIELTAYTANKTYDGTPLTSAGYQITKGSFVDGEGLANVTVTGSQTDVGESANKITDYTLKDNTLAENYTITRVDGTLIVWAKALTITADSASKPYDGTPLTKNTYASTELANGDTIESVTVTGSQTDVGSSDNVASAAVIKNASGKNVTGNYKITYKSGTLTVTASGDIQNNITLKTVDVEHKYDGNTYTAGTATAIDSKGGAVKIEYSVDGATWTTNPGTITAKNVSESKTILVRASGANYTGYVTGTQELTITKRTVTLTSASDEKVYDGKALTNGTVKVTGDGFVSGEGASYNVTGSQTNVGKSDNSFTYTLNAGTIADNYNITTEVGKLEVKPSGDIQNSITLTTADVEHKYDGNTYNAGTASATDENGGEVTIEYSADNGATWTTDPTTIKATNVADSVTIQVRASGANYTGYVTGTQKLTITKRTVTLTSETATKPYDGTALTRPTVAVSGDGFVTGEVSGITATGSVTYVTDGPNKDGVVENTIEYTKNDSFVEDNYTITERPGTLTITKRTDVIVITTPTRARAYNGRLLWDGACDYTGTLAEGDELIITFATDHGQRNVGSMPNQFESYRVENKATGANVTANYTFGEHQIGTLTVTPVAIELTAYTANKTYDGTPLTSAGYQITKGSFVDGEGLADVTVTGSQTDVGESANKITDYTLKDNTLAKNYTITCVEGTLIVWAKALTITADSASKPYDGTPLMKNTYVSTELANGDTIESVTVTGSQTDVGSSDNVASAAVIKNASGKNVTGNYKITYKPGTLTVTASGDIQNNITLKTVDVVKKYDGNTYNAGTASATDKNGGEVTIEYSADGKTWTDNPGTITAKNVSDSKTIQVRVTSANYEGSVTGTQKLTITKREVKLTSASDEKVYDGTALTNGTVTVTGDDFVTGEGASYTVTGSQTNVGKSDNSFTYTLNAGTIANNYIITTEVGKLEVKASGEIEKNITLTTTDVEHKYDGNTYNAGTASATDKNGGEVTIEYSADNGATWTTDPTTIKATNVADSVTVQVRVTSANYEGSVTGEQKLTITKRTVKLTSASDEKVYDGTALTNGTVTVTGDGFVTGEGASYTVTGSQTNVGTSDNSFTYTLNEGTLEGNYTITTEVGKLEVTPVTAQVTVKVYEASSNVTYDGQPHSIHGYTKMEADNPLYAATTANIKVTETAAWTATGTDAGEYEVGIEPGNFQNTNGNFTNVVFEIVHGKLVIEKAETVKIELKGNTKTTTYTGSEQSVKGITEVSNPAGAVWTLNEGKEAKASGTDAGKYMMGLTAADFTATSPNYKTVTVKYTDGYLDITPITKEVTVTVTGATKTVAYNRAEQSVTGHTVNTNGLPITVTLNAAGKDTVSGTNAGTYMMGLTAADFTATSRNYTNIKLIVNDGWLKIDPITTETTVYVYGNTDYRYYNRNIQTVEGFEVGYGTDPTISVKLADGKKAIAAGRTVKTYIMGLTEKHFVATSPNYTNIKLVVEDGWLAILPNPDEIVVTIRGNSDTVTYDGKEHTVTGYTVEVEDEVFAIELRTKGKDTAKGTEPGTYNMGLTAADFRVESKNYSNVKVIVEDGALKIEPVTGPTPTPDPTEPTPTPELEDIEDPDTPTTGYTRAWALVNLICAILTVIFSVVLLIGLAGKKTKTEEAENGEEVEKEIKKKKFWRFFSIVPALAAVIVFLLTEDMRLPMVFVDRWTLLMVIIGLVQVLVMVFAKKTKKDPDEEEKAKA